MGQALVYYRSNTVTVSRRDLMWVGGHIRVCLAVKPKPVGDSLRESLREFLRGSLRESM